MILTTLFVIMSFATLLWIYRFVTDNSAGAAMFDKPRSWSKGFFGFEFVLLIALIVSSFTVLGVSGLSNVSDNNLAMEFMSIESSYDDSMLFEPDSAHWVLFTPAVDSTDQFMTTTLRSLHERVDSYNYKVSKKQEQQKSFLWGNLIKKSTIIIVVKPDPTEITWVDS